ncbi:hypothetical protein Syun_002899 [Stephania yunnanensis]|uniref:Uncharacterized protein n=1 Tax=Stephania yunnanensis TaxID=152371 RepID=A0AAP0L055_9MAGN
MYLTSQATNFSHNNLIGEIPSSLGNLKHLQSLDLSNNDLTGEIPSELARLTFLSVFNVSLNHLVGRIPSGTQFDTFSRNSFQGNLGLCGSQLQIQCNPKTRDDAPTSEKPPSSIENSSSDFDWRFALAGCGSGIIIGVKASGELRTSHSTKQLSHNSLVGKIPSSLANLTQLESLDLSNNDLVGVIPSELTSLTFLSVLNVSQNHLIGTIPSGRQFLTFPGSSFEGNSRLCGIQLQIDCNPKKSGNVALPSVHANQSNGTNFDWICAVAGYGSGLVVGVVIEHFVLWRNKYYLEKFMNTIRFFQGKSPLRVRSLRRRGN